MAWTTPRTSRLGFFLCMAGWLLVLGSPAGATTLYAKFYNGTTGYTQAYSGTGTVYDVTKNKPGGTDCPTGYAGCGGTDVIQPSLDFTIGGVGIHATATTEVWDDVTPNFGGLGVGSHTDDSDADQISAAAGDSLTLTFSIPITLNGAGTLFDIPHEDFGTQYLHAGDVITDQSSVQFYLTVLGLNGDLPFLVNFADANNGLLDYTGTTFIFTAVTGGPDYYVSALVFDPTPIPATLPLFATGLGALGLLGWRRKRKKALVAA